jgi:hypothetical protein
LSMPRCSGFLTSCASRTHVWMLSICEWQVRLSVPNFHAILMAKLGSRRSQPQGRRAASLSGKWVRRVTFYMNRRRVFHEPAPIIIHSVSVGSMVTNDATHCVQPSHRVTDSAVNGPAGRRSRSKPISSLSVQTCHG